MWLALCGVHASRGAAKRWFAVRPSSWTGASHAAVAGVIARHLPAAVGGWQRHRLRAPAQLATIAAALLSDGWPVLVTAICELREPAVRCRHAFVITSIDRNRIDLLDPLGRPPAHGSRGNAWIDASQPARRLVEVQGAPWRLDLDRIVAVYLPLERGDPGSQRG